MNTEPVEFRMIPAWATHDQEIVVTGWVDSVRKHGKLTFFDLRNDTGRLQCVARNVKFVNSDDAVHLEQVVLLVGKAKKRPDNMVNHDQELGAYEFVVDTMMLCNAIQPMPIPVEGDGYDINEDQRMKFRYIDLRRSRLQKNLRLRSKLVYGLREALEEMEYVEIETPMLTKATKEGARDFLVPSRFHPGKHYALPQSPQQYKQLLMTAGFSKYFQFARCMRDEDPRADRGFEFTQLDLEMAWPEQERIWRHVEYFIAHALNNNNIPYVHPEPGIEYEHGLIFPVYTYAQALKEFGTDKPDLRTEEDKKAGRLAFCWIKDYPIFKQVDKGDAVEVADGKSGWTFTHNPFSMPHPDCWNDHIAGHELGSIRAQQYDLVCNGYELGSGSIRAHTSQLLQATFRNMGYSPAEIEAGIGHMLEAFDLGTPPHGGIALGIDRLAMLACGETSIKEVIAFPTSSSGRTSVMDAPA